MTTPEAIELLRIELAGLRQDAADASERAAQRNVSRAFREGAEFRAAYASKKADALALALDALAKKEG